MINYLSSFTNTNGISYPGTGFINATSPGATDGTEFVKLFGDDIWLARQAIMTYAGLTPDGVTEAVGTSQFVEALQKGFGAATGMITESPTSADPATLGYRCFLVQGQGVLIASFPELDEARYVGDGTNAAVHAGGGKFYRASDAGGTNPNILGPFLILPDARGVVARGLDLAASIDPDGASRFLGDLQVDSLQGHWHDALGEGSAGGEDNISTGTTSFPGDNIDAGAIRDASTDTVNGTPRTSSETRMYNRSTNFVIWY